jgi:quercetin dioxygenase-like cupin family protein
MKKLVLGLAVVGLCAMSGSAQEAHIAKAATTKFMTLPVAPQCLQLAAQEGDPMKGAATILMKASSGCMVPWHWHTANERLYIVSGRGKAEMKDHPAETVAAGDFVVLPGKMVHQFTCVSTCTFFDVTDAAFDIHYVKADGTEIPPEEALKAGAKQPAAKKEGAPPKP